MSDFSLCCFNKDYGEKKFVKEIICLAYFSQSWSLIEGIQGRNSRQERGVRNLKQSTGSPMGELEKGRKELKKFAAP